MFKVTVEETNERTVRLSTPDLQRAVEWALNRISMAGEVGNTAVGNIYDEQNKTLWECTNFAEFEPRVTLYDGEVFDAERLMPYGERLGG